nr:uroporphyrinogen decarboxylase family protein [Candidatus Sigynarchaeum springense]
MDLRERVLRILRHQPVDRAVWQPSLTYWYTTNRVGSITPATAPSSARPFVPDGLMGLDPVQLYERIQGSIRYPHECLNLPSFYTQLLPGSKVERRATWMDNKELVETVKTPVGTIQKRSRDGFPLEHYVKTTGDIDAVEYWLACTEYCFNPYMFDAASEVIEHLGVVQTYNFRSPYQRSVIEFLGLATTTRFLRKHPRRMETFFDRLLEWDKSAYEVILDSPLQVVSFGENIDANLSPPPVFEKFHVPYYKERIKRVHEKGKLCHIHMDGDLNGLLQFLPELDFDGIEAVTFKPQGNVSIEEVVDAMGKKVLLDGIPSIYFLPQYSDEDVLAFARRVLDAFYPRIILGISDELCPTMQGHKLGLVGYLVANYP